ncbi:MAG: undecaprenyl/decaprenyl-phosphate alpha-N-acetylglucosaminyl 1-phosphate transferase [Deltaproteobacteria bacterium]|nr:undecaprenyl/decaprenyl-phosphate alpha-N-acetylglucosaminyl 1-phosphate transferase [Deltaproteobacteria bacterium]
MIAPTVAFILALVLALALTPLVRALAHRVGAVDDPDASHRKIHQRSIPRMGGLAIVVAFFVPLAGLLVVDSEVGRYFAKDATKVMGLFAGGLVIALLGVYDDIKGANAPKKFIVQFAVALAMYLLGFRIGGLSTPFGFAIDLGIFDLPVTLLWIVGVINAMNLIDGLDGLASGIAFFAALTTLVVAALNGNVLMILFMATTLGAVLGFLFYNFNPASIFMGDTGSMFLGFVMAVTAVQTNTKGAATVAMLTPVLALGLPIMDTFLAMLRRYLRGRSMFQADREHVHHKLLGAGLSQRGAVLVMYALSLVLGLAAVAVTVTKGLQMALVLSASLVAVALFMRKLGYLSPAQFRRDREAALEERRYNLDVRRAVREVRRALRVVTTIDDAWRAVTALCEALSVYMVELRLQGIGAASGEEARSFVWQSSVAPAKRPFAARFELAPERGGGKIMLDLTWADGRAEMTAYDEYAVGATADELAAACSRLWPTAATGRVVALRARRVR